MPVKEVNSKYEKMFTAQHYFGHAVEAYTLSAGLKLSNMCTRKHISTVSALGACFRHV
jgi:Zn-dependent peptidase ImmA (M78 family)